jgi:hypothetical protein
MKVTVVEKHPMKRGRKYDAQYKRVKFKLEDGSVAFTDLCPDFINFSKWKDKIEIGDVLDGIVLLTNKNIDADKSRPRLVHRPPKQKELL